MLVKTAQYEFIPGVPGSPGQEGGTYCPGPPGDADPPAPGTDGPCPNIQTRRGANGCVIMDSCGSTATVCR